jgi:hypothetical protein
VKRTVQSNGRKNADIALAERQLHALRLRSLGASYSDIANALDVSTATAWRSVKAGLDRTIREPAQDMILIELQRLDRLHAAIWGQAIGITSGAPDLGAIDRILAIMQRRSKLLGLDAPTKQVVTGQLVMKDAAEQIAQKYGLDPAEVLAEAEALLRSVSDE